MGIPESSAAGPARNDLKHMREKGLEARMECLYVDWKGGKWIQKRLSGEKVDRNLRLVRELSMQFAKWLKVL